MDSGLRHPRDCDPYKCSGSAELLHPGSWPALAVNDTLLQRFLRVHVGRRDLSGHALHLPVRRPYPGLAGHGPPVRAGTACQRNHRACHGGGPDGVCLRLYCLPRLRERSFRRCLDRVCPDPAGDSASLHGGGYGAVVCRHPRQPGPDHHDRHLRYCAGKGNLMSDPVTGLVLLVVLMGFLASGLWIALSLTAVAGIALMFFSNASVGPNLATIFWGHSHSWSLTALPLFILMGEILLRSRLSRDMFSGLAPWLGGLPGRLLHVNVLGCAIFAAVSGSSAATAATIGKMSIPELRSRGYPESLILGTLAGSATLGLLIPPSIILIVYGVATEQSIARLFVAGVLPGILLVGLFIGYVVIWAILNRKSLPDESLAVGFAERLRRSRRLIPVVLLILGVIGSIYAGLASPTDAAAVGVVLALILSWTSGSLTKQSFLDGLMGATVTSCMIAFILAGASFLTVAMGFTGIPRILAEWIGSLGLSTFTLLAALTVFFVIMGCFLDGISVVVLTASVIMPMVLEAGIDPMWFGIFLVIVVEMSQITPPVGFNLFVLQSLTGRDILFVAMAALPFFLLMVLALILISVFPGIVTYLPGQM